MSPPLSARARGLPGTAQGPERLRGPTGTEEWAGLTRRGLASPGRARTDALPALRAPRAPRPRAAALRSAGSGPVPPRRRPPRPAVRCSPVRSGPGALGGSCRALPAGGGGGEGRGGRRGTGMRALALTARASLGRGRGPDGARPPRRVPAA